MNTAQIYAGRGKTIPLSVSAVEKSAQSVPTPDAWLIDQTQTHLLDLVDSFMGYASPVVAITDLLDRWLTTPPADLADPINQQQLKAVLRLVDFLTELRETHAAWLVATEQTPAQKGGQTNG